MEVKIKIVKEGARLPLFGNEYAAGADLCACLDYKSITVLPGETKLIDTGLSMELPSGYVGLIYARSGLACKQGLTLANGVGVIDSDYRGEFKVALYNTSKEIRTISNGDRIAQLIIMPYPAIEFVEVSELSDTERGTGGFGSTGIK